MNRRYLKNNGDFNKCEKYLDIYIVLELCESKMIMQFLFGPNVLSSALLLDQFEKILHFLIIISSFPLERYIFPLLKKT